MEKTEMPNSVHNVLTMVRKINIVCAYDLAHIPKEHREDNPNTAGEGRDAVKRQTMWN